MNPIAIFSCTNCSSAGHHRACWRIAIQLCHPQSRGGTWLQIAPSVLQRAHNQWQHLTPRHRDSTCRRFTPAYPKLWQFSQSASVLVSWQLSQSIPGADHLSWPLPASLTRSDALPPFDAPSGAERAVGSRISQIAQRPARLGNSSRMFSSASSILVSDVRCTACKAFKAFQPALSRFTGGIACESTGKSGCAARSHAFFSTRARIRFVPDRCTHAGHHAGRIRSATDVRFDQASLFDARAFGMMSSLRTGQSTASGA